MVFLSVGRSIRLAGDPTGPCRVFLPCLRFVVLRFVHGRGWWYRVISVSFGSSVNIFFIFCYSTPWDDRFARSEHDRYFGTLTPGLLGAVDGGRLFWVSVSSIAFFVFVFRFFLFSIRVGFVGHVRRLHVTAVVGVGNLRFVVRAIWCVRNFCYGVL